MGPGQGAYQEQQGQADDEGTVELELCGGHQGYQGDPRQCPDVLVALDPLGRPRAHGVIALEQVFAYGVCCEPPIPEGPQGMYMSVEERPISSRCDETPTAAAASCGHRSRVTRRDFHREGHGRVSHEGEAIGRILLLGGVGEEGLFGVACGLAQAGHPRLEDGLHEALIQQLLGLRIGQAC